MRQAATFESQGLLAAAERDSAAARQEVADQRARVLAELKHAQDSTNQAMQAMLSKATELQQAAGERVTEETEHAARLRSEMFAQAEQVKVDASTDAEHIIDRARHQAASIDDRARQELALRRRQMRNEQDLLNRRKHAMLNQLTSLSALAVETAENLPDVPEVPDAEFSAIVGFGREQSGNEAEMESDPTIGNAADEAGLVGEDKAAEEEPESQQIDEDGQSRVTDEETETPPVEGDDESTDQPDYTSASNPSAA
jgi:hypothetical protein